MSDFQATDASGCGCCAGVCTLVSRDSRGREEMGGGEKRQEEEEEGADAELWM